MAKPVSQSTSWGPEQEEMAGVDLGGGETEMDRMICLQPGQEKDADEDTHANTHIHAHTRIQVPIYSHTCSFLWLEKVLRNKWPAHILALYLLAGQPQSLLFLLQRERSHSWAQARPTWQLAGE